MIIRVKNTLDQSALYSFLGGTIPVGAGTIGVKNNASYTANWAIQLGKTGEEKSEIKVISSISGTNLVLTGTTVFDHPIDTPVYAIKFDQLIFKRSTAGTSGTATALTNGTVSITPDSLFTQFDDTTGASTYAYKVSYRNSASGDVSSDSTWITPTGYTFYSLYKLRDRVRNKLFSIGYLNTGDGQINDWINEWLETMNNSAVKVNQDYNIGTVDVAYGTAGFGTISSTDYKDIRKLDFTTNGTDFYRARKMQTTDFIPGEIFNETHPYYYMIGDNVFGRKPEGTSGTARITYYRLGTTLSYDTDELPVVMRGYTKSFVDYGLSQAYFLDNKTQLGQNYMQMALASLKSFEDEITPRSYSGPVLMKITDPIDADESLGYFF